MKKLILMLTVLLGGVVSLAQVAPVDPAADFLSQVSAAVQAFGGMSTLLKIASIVGLVIASLKVSALNDMIWSKLGALQAWLAPVLGLVYGLVSMAAKGQPLTVAAVFAYLTAGAGAVVLHELLDTVKAIPGIGTVYVALINMIESALGGGSTPPPAA